MKTYGTTVNGRAVRVTVPENDHGIEELTTAAAALLERLDNMTSEEFGRGGEQAQRERLRQALAAVR